jgi:hypothetical protein
MCPTSLGPQLLAQVGRCLGQAGWGLATYQCGFLSDAPCLSCHRLSWIGNLKKNQGRITKGSGGALEWRNWQNVLIQVTKVNSVRTQRTRPLVDMPKDTASLLCLPRLHNLHVTRRQPDPSAWMRLTSVILATLGGWDQEDFDLRPAWANLWNPSPNLQNNQNKMDWRCGSSSRLPGLQVWSPQFKSQSHQNKQTKTLKWLVCTLQKCQAHKRQKLICSWSQETKDT